jgi:TonB family protein
MEAVWRSCARSSGYNATMASPIVRSIAALTIAACSLTLVFAQEHASGHELQNHDSPAGRSPTAGGPTRRLDAPDPAYTEAARAAKINGTVVLEGLLGTDGCLREIRVVRSLGYGLDENAVSGLKRWKFRAFEKGGVPTETEIRIEINFDPAWSPDHADFSKATCGTK